MKSKIQRKLAGVASALFLLALPASAAQGTIYTIGGDPALPTDGSWQGPYDEFNGGVGSYFQETWTLSGSAELRITDLYVPGDQFAIYDNGVLLGDSSVVADWSTYESNAYTSPPYTTDPGTAWLDSHFSHFDYFLGSGPHSITIQETVEPSGFTDSTYSISAVPEPESFTLVLAGIGVGGFMLMAYRRQGK